MTTREWINETFHHARRLEEAERDPYLDERCAGRPEHRSEVEQLLKADRLAESALPTPSQGTLVGASRSRVGEVIAGCRLVERIAAGGMGVVYEAEQSEPRRKVALKLLRTALQRPEDVLRFRHEIRIVGRLRHPSIAQIYSAGTADDGTPYLVMELVAGARDLGEYAPSLSVRRRIELFCTVCDAVQFGHGQGVIHRDLKPSNILVDVDGRPVLIDFGIARLADDGTNATRVDLTQSGAIFGTLAYLSPEQIRGGTSRGDARSDVYALGIILFGLLTAKRSPYGEDITDFELAQRVLNRAPDLSGVAGDLGMVVGKALRKDPRHRYASADALAADLHRYLESRPITARPPTLSYQAKMFARRHRAAVGVACVAALLLSGTTVWSLINASRADDARVLAEDARAEAEHEAARAGGMLLESQKLVQFTIEEHIQSLARLPGTLPARLALSDVVEQRLDRLDTHAGEDPELRRLTARHFGQLAKLNIDDLGRVDRAKVHIDRAFLILERLAAQGLDPQELIWQRAWLLGQREAVMRHDGDKEGGHKTRDQAISLLDGARQDAETGLLLADLHLSSVTWLRSHGDEKGALRRIDLAKQALALARDDSTRRQERLLLSLKAATLSASTLAKSAPAAAAQAIQAGEAALRELVALAGRDGAFPAQHATLESAGADVAHAAGRLSDVVTHVDAAISFRARAVEEEPSSRKFRRDLAVATATALQMRLFAAEKARAGVLPARQEDEPEDVERARALLTEAVAQGRRAARLYAALIEKVPTHTGWRQWKVLAQHNTAAALFYLRRWEDALSLISTYEKEALHLAELAPLDHMRHMMCAQAHSLRGNVYYQRAGIAYGEEKDPALAASLCEKSQRAFLQAHAVLVRAVEAGVDHPTILRMRDGVKAAADGAGRTLAQLRGAAKKVR